jgi:DNA-binding response OmpR family regulator
MIERAPPSCIADAIHVLLISDDPIFRETVSERLLAQGFSIRHLDGGTSSTFSAKDHAIVLLSDCRGGPECSTFSKGANDVDHRTCGVEILVRGLNSVVRDLKAADQPQSDEAMICGQLLLRPKVARAYWNNTDLGLTLSEYKIVHLLASNVARHVTYRAIYDRQRHQGFAAGSGTEGFRVNVRSAILRIRRKFRAVDLTFDKIENYPCFGYRWKTAA